MSIMTEEELRAIVRNAVARHLKGERSDAPVFREPENTSTSVQSLIAHASHVRLPVLAGDRLGEGACLIEPSVGCNHCGYCQSYGH
jgi:hypothetical protein